MIVDSFSVLYVRPLSGPCRTCKTGTACPSLESGVGRQRTVPVFRRGGNRPRIAGRKGELATRKPALHSLDAMGRGGKCQFSGVRSAWADNIVLHFQVIVPSPFSLARRSRTNRNDGTLPTDGRPAASVRIRHEFYSRFPGTCHIRRELRLRNKTR